MSEEIRQALRDLGKAYSEGRTGSVEIPPADQLRPMDECDQTNLAFLAYLYEQEENE